MFIQSYMLVYNEDFCAKMLNIIPVITLHYIVYVVVDVVGEAMDWN